MLTLFGVFVTAENARHPVLDDPPEGLGKLRGVLARDHRDRSSD